MPHYHVFHWSPGIGDPTIGGWVTVALYFFAMISCWRTSITLVRRHGSSEHRIWLAIALLFLFLGINKQLDLQSALTEIGRMIAFDEGWYGQRRSVQAFFILFVIVSCTLTALTLVLLAYRAPIPTWFALIGITFVLGFVVIRSASFHHVDLLIGRRVFGLRWNWVLEMGGILIVLIASEWRRKMKTAAMA